MCPPSWKGRSAGRATSTAFGSRPGLARSWPSKSSAHGPQLSRCAATPGLRPDCTFQPGSLECQQGILTGSTQLSNATIETFTQSQSAQGNCFACHNTVQVSSLNSTTPSLPGLNVNISHVLINHYFAPTSTREPRP